MKLRQQELLAQHGLTGKEDWGLISKHQHLSEDFIREFKDKVDWLLIAEYQHLSEDFIREFKNKVNWELISTYQHLSEDFIREFKDLVNWGLISKHQHLSKDFIREFNLSISEDNWLYKDKHFKEQKIRECGLYECHDDYFLAYKSIRKDRYSHYNFQYQYLPGGVYKSRADCTDNESSFGLAAWTEEKARDYNNSGIIVVVKIRYEDVARLVHNSGKIRCTRLEIMS